MARKKVNVVASVAKSDSRLAVNLFSAAMTVLVLLAATEVSHGGLSNSINGIGRNLGDLVDYAPVYSIYTENETYRSRISPFNPRGMAGWYELTAMFMDVLLPKDFLIKDAVEIHNDLPRVVSWDIPKFLETYWPFLLMVVALVLPIILIPLCGIVFCCCSCCGNCGPPSQQRTKKRNRRKENLLAMLLVLLVTALLFCVVCTFASNEQMRDGLDELPKTVRSSVADAKLYLESAKKQAKHLFVTNFDEFFKIFNQTINRSSKNVMHQLDIRTTVSAMMDLNAFVVHLPKIKGSLETLKIETNSMRASASQLNDATYKVKEDLLNTLVICVLPECRDVLNNLGQLRTNIDFNTLPDVSATLNQLGDLDSDALKNAVDVGIDKLNSIETEIEMKFDENLQKVADQVKDAGTTVATYLNNMMDAIESVQHEVNRQTGSYSKLVLLDMYNKSLSPYTYYWGLAISGLLLLVTICIALGLICGICGKKTDGYSEDCCNKNAGSHFLTCSVITMIIFGMFLALVVLATFVLGISTDRVVCYPIRNPEHSEVINIMEDNYVRSARPGNLKFYVKEVLSRCYKNESIYNVFSLKSKLDIDALQEKFDVSSYLDQMLEQLNGILDNDFEILSKENEKTLESLKMVHPSINFDQFQDELKGNLSNLSFDEILEKLRLLVTTNAWVPQMDMVKKEVSSSILKINSYQENLLMPMKQKANTVTDIAKQLDLDLKMNSTSFSVAITKMLAEIKGAQDVLQTNGTQILKKAAKELGTLVLNQVDSYVYRVEDVMKNELAQCGPWNVMINATLIATCDKILLPFNGYWFSLFVSLILFIPTMIVSDKLATLYQNDKEYEQFVEIVSTNYDEKKPKQAKFIRNSYRIWEKATRILEKTRRNLTRQTPDTLIP